MRGIGAASNRRGFSRSTAHRILLSGAASLCTLCVALALASDAFGYVRVSAPSIRVIPSHDVLEHYTTETPGGDLLFAQPSGVTVKFVTNPNDPEIINPGSGAFHPPSTDLVVSAIESIDPLALRALIADIFILPYPRSGLLSSSAGDDDIYISPGVMPYADVHVHFLVSHELGHCLHRQLLKDDDEEGWAAYRRIRGIEDERFDDRGPHAYRPREIFAEDFRVLFGSDLARGDGSVENPEIVPPDHVPGLREYFEGLLQGASAPSALADTGPRWSMSPNPLRPGASLLLRANATPNHTGDLEVDIFDLNGRRVAQSSARPVGGNRWFVDFEGRDEGGRNLPSGAYWARVREPSGSGRMEPAIVPFRYLH